MNTAETTFQAVALPAGSFASLATLPQAALETRGVRRVPADSKPGCFNCRIERAASA